MQMYQKPRIVANILGVSQSFLRNAAERGELPKGAVICTPGNHRSYDVDMVRQWMEDNVEKLNKPKRRALAEARA